MVVQRRDRSPEHGLVVGELRMGRHGSPPDTSRSSHRFGITGVERGRQAPRSPGRGMELPDVAEPHVGDGWRTARPLRSDAAGRRNRSPSRKPPRAPRAPGLLRHEALFARPCGSSPSTRRFRPRHPSRSCRTSNCSPSTRFVLPSAPNVRWGPDPSTTGLPPMLTSVHDVPARSAAEVGSGVEFEPEPVECSQAATTRMVRPASMRIEGRVLGMRGSFDVRTA